MTDNDIIHVGLTRAQRQTISGWAADVVTKTNDEIRMKRYATAQDIYEDVETLRFRCSHAEMIRAQMEASL